MKDEIVNESKKKATWKSQKSGKFFLIIIILCFIMALAVLIYFIWDNHQKLNQCEKEVNNYENIINEGKNRGYDIESLTANGTLRKVDSDKENKINYISYEEISKEVVTLPNIKTKDATISIKDNRLNYSITVDDLLKEGTLNLDKDVTSYYYINTDNGLPALQFIALTKDNELYHMNIKSYTDEGKNKICGPIIDGSIDEAEFTKISLGDFKAVGIYRADSKGSGALYVLTDKDRLFKLEYDYCEGIIYLGEEYQK